MAPLFSLRTLLKLTLLSSSLAAIGTASVLATVAWHPTVIAPAGDSWVDHSAHYSVIAAFTSLGTGLHHGADWLPAEVSADTDAAPPSASGWIQASRADRSDMLIGGHAVWAVPVVASAGRGPSNAGPGASPQEVAQPATGPSGGGSGSHASVSSLLSRHQADQSGRVYIGYVDSARSAWFTSVGKSAEQLFQSSELASIPSTFTHVVVTGASPQFRWSGVEGSWAGTGLSFSATPRDVQAAIAVLHQRQMRVLLSVGGEAGRDWSALAAEGRRGGGPTIRALARVQRELGFDGLDLDQRTDTDPDRYAQVIQALRRAVDLAGGGRVLSVAAWSTGADCVPETSDEAACNGRVSYWGGHPGRERRLLALYPQVAEQLDMVNVMAYDVGVRHFDPALAYEQYRAMFPARVVVSMGIQPAPEVWGGAALVLNDADAQCMGATIEQDQYSWVVNQPYSLERLIGTVLTHNLPGHRRDGLMLWTLQKQATGICGATPLPGAADITQRVADAFGLPIDPV